MSRYLAKLYETKLFKKCCMFHNDLHTELTTAIKVSVSCISAGQLAALHWLRVFSEYCFAEVTQWWRMENIVVAAAVITNIVCVMCTEVQSGVVQQRQASHGSSFRWQCMLCTLSCLLSAIRFPSVVVLLTCCRLRSRATAIWATWLRWWRRSTWTWTRRFAGSPSLTSELPTTNSTLLHLYFWCYSIVVFVCQTISRLFV